MFTIPPYLRSTILRPAASPGHKRPPTVEVEGRVVQRSLLPRPSADAITRRGKAMPKTLFEKIWETHVVHEEPGEPALLYVDLHLLHEVTSPQAFEGLRLSSRRVRRPDRTLATMDHAVPTDGGPVTDPLAKAQLDALLRKCGDCGVPGAAPGRGG